MKKRNIIFIVAAILVVLIIIIVAILNILNKHNVNDEEKVIDFSKEEINNMNDIMSDKLQDFATDISKNKVINAKMIDDLKDELKNEIGYDVEVSMEAKMMNQNVSESDTTDNQDVLFGKVYKEKNNEQLIEEIEKNGKVKMSSSDIFSISVTLKNKKLLKDGQPYASYSMVIN